ncbi:hypothetical protein ACLKA6_015835 [Drosophila palustris]
MSFLSSMQQYVTSGISSLGLGNRRFSLSRQESSEHQSNAGGVSAAAQQQQLLPPQQQQQLQQQQAQQQQLQQQQQQLQQSQQQQQHQQHPPLQQQHSIGSGLGGLSGAGGNVYGPPTQPTVGVAATTGGGSNYPAGGVVIGNPNATNPLLGYPKVVPLPGSGAATGGGSSSSAGSTPINSRRQSRALECLAPPRTGSFRSRNSALHQPDPPPRPPLAFCKRRLSWPEVDPRSNSGVQETDGSYFENFTSLGWKRENRRMSATRAAESRAEANPENERDPPAPEESIDRQDEKEKLYVDVLHTIANTVGAPAPGGQET